jgi:hypothetical protein
MAALVSVAGAKGEEEEMGGHVVAVQANDASFVNPKLPCVLVVLFSRFW